MNKSKLFSAYKMGNLTLKNRVVMALLISTPFILLVKRGILIIRMLNKEVNKDKKAAIQN